MSQGQSQRISEPPAWAERRAGPALIVIAAVLLHLALLAAGRSVLSTLSDGAARATVLPFVTSGVAIILAAPLGMRLFYRTDTKAWWLVAPAAAVVAVGALRATWSHLNASTSLGAAAVTAFGASLALSASATILTVRAGVQARQFVSRRAALPLLVGMGGLAAVAVAAAQRMPPSLLPLPAALVGVTAIAVTCAMSPGADARRPAAADAVLIAWITLGAIALASYATGAATLAAQLTRSDALAEGRRIILASWFHSFPVVAAMIAGFGLRLSQIGLATRSRKLDVLGTIGLLVLGVAIARNQIRGAFNLAQSGTPNTPLARALARTRPTPLPVQSVPPGPPALAAATPEIEAAAPALEHGSMRVGLPAVDGPLLEKDALGGIKRIIARLNACYAERRPPRQPGSAGLRFVVDKRGSVAHVELKDSTLSEGVSRCVQAEMYRTGFASPSGERAVIVAPIEFVEIDSAKR
jgi:hypothetical protein